MLEGRKEYKKINKFRALAEEYNMYKKIKTPASI
jgi:hypothetical protein